MDYTAKEKGRNRKFSLGLSVMEAVQSILAVLAQKSSQSN